jgi:hypothetical protein
MYKKKINSILLFFKKNIEINHEQKTLEKF